MSDEVQALSRAMLASPTYVVAFPLSARIAHPFASAEALGCCCCCWFRWHISRLRCVCSQQQHQGTLEHTHRLVLRHGARAATRRTRQTRLRSGEWRAVCVRVDDRRVVSGTSNARVRRSAGEVRPSRSRALATRDPIGMSPEAQGRTSGTRCLTMPILPVSSTPRSRTRRSSTASPRLGCRTEKTSCTGQPNSATWKLWRRFAIGPPTWLKRSPRTR